MRGRFAIPVHDPSGILLAYCGRAVKDESPLLLFPNGFDPRIAIFNANRIVEGDLFLVRDPLQVLTAHESGIENVVAFLTENVTAYSLNNSPRSWTSGSANIWRCFEPAQAGSFSWRVLSALAKLKQQRENLVSTEVIEFCLKRDRAVNLQKRLPRLIALFHGPEFHCAHSLLRDFEMRA